MTAVEHEPTHTTVMHELEDFLDQWSIHYEVIDGAIVVNPPPTWDHQEFLMEILAGLHRAAPPELVVMPAGLHFYYEPGSYLEPDVVVCRRSDRRREGLRGTPLLVVELLSPSTRRIDLGRKKEIYRDAGVPSYWVVDPDARELTVLTLIEGDYQQTQQLSGQQELSVTGPFPATLRPFG
jgi:Uma2 family endonuclease